MENVWDVPYGECHAPLRGEPAKLLLMMRFSRDFLDVHARYEAKKKSTNTMDFDDLLEKTVRLLRESDEVAERYQRQFQLGQANRRNEHRSTRV